MARRPNRILVTGSSTFFAARLIHDLGRRGASITAGDSLSISAGKASRYTSKRLLLPAIGKDPGLYLDTLIRELRSGEYDLLLPAFEESLLLAEYQSELRPYTRLFLPDFPVMYQLHHKPSLHRMCESLGLPTPPTAVVARNEQLSKASERLGFPVVVKLPASNNSVGRTFCENETELNDTFQRLSAEQLKEGRELPFIQKKIQGDLICTLSFCSQGKKLGEVVYRTLRMFPQAGGTSVHRQSMRHPEISRMTERVIAATRWSGFVGFDFLLERETGIPYLIDANVRANPAIHLGYCAGLDWSQIILDLANDQTPAVQEAESGINVHTLFMDVAWLLEGLRPSSGGLGAFPRRCREFASPAWKVHSRGDLLGTGETYSAIVMGLQTLYSGLKSIVTGRTAGQLMLDDANYNPTTAAEFRATRVTRQRVAA